MGPHSKGKSNSRLFPLLVAVLLFALPAPIIYAQPYLTHNYAIEEGLIQSQASALFQDKEGYLWIGTQGGVSRFDGLTFKHYTVDEGLISNRTQALQEDVHGQLWAGSSNGITIFTASGFEYLTTKDGLLDNNVNDLLLASDGTMWITSQSGLSRYDGVAFQHYTGENGLNASLAISVKEGDNKDIWVTTVAGLCRLQGARITCFDTANGLPHAVVTDVFIDKKHRVWAGTSAGVAFISQEGLAGDGPARFTPRTDLPPMQVHSLLEDSMGALWIGAVKGVVRLDSTGALTHSWLDGNWIVRPLLEDREHNIWAGTSGRGIVKFQRTAFTHLNPALELPQDVYLSVFEDSKQSIWAGAMTHGLYRIDSAAVVHFDPVDHPLLQHVRTLSEDKNGVIWIGSGYGVSRFDGHTFTNFTTREGLSQNYVYGILADKKERVWIGTINGLNVLEDDKIRTIDLDMGADQQVVFAFCEDAGDQIWIGTAQGLMYFENDTLHKIPALAERPISSILRDPSGDLWLGTLGFGVYRFNPTSAEIVDTLTTSNGLNSATVYFTKFDGRGDLWIGTSNGVNQVDTEAYWMERTKNIRAFGKQDGIVGLETNTNAATLDHLGRLWFGTIDALILYEAASHPKNQTPPPVQLAGVRLYLEPVKLEEYQNTNAEAQNAALRFPYNKNHLTFDFLGLSYTAPDLVRYQYRLNGFDSDWQPATSSRFVTYANLPPGHYSFEVIAINNDGIKSVTPAILTFSVTPPFWETPWFIALSVIFSILGVIGLIHHRTQSLNKRRQALEETVAERTEDLRKTHGELLEAREAALQAAKSKSAFMSAMTHELRTPMNGILGMTQVLTVTSMDEEQLDCAHTIMECGAMMMDLIENILTFADLAAGQRRLSIEQFKLPELLDETISDQRLQSGIKQLETRYFLAPDVPLEIKADREHTRQILKHLLSNAVKFTQAGVIFLEVQLERRQQDGNPATNLLFSVHDTGIGMEDHQLKRVFEAFSQADMSITRQFQGAGIGLALVQQLTMLLNGKLGAKSWPGVGSSFYFSLPLQVDHLPALLSEGKPTPLNGKHIHLMIDDAREHRRLALLCRSMGMVVAEKVEDAKKIDVVIADPANAGKAVRYPQAAFILLDEGVGSLDAGAVLPPEASGAAVEEVLGLVAAI